MTAFVALVGPIGTVHSLCPDAEQAKRQVRIGLEMAADVSPGDARIIDGVIERMEAAEVSFVDYFKIDGEDWTAQFFEEVSPGETEQEEQ